MLRPSGPAPKSKRGAEAVTTPPSKRKREAEEPAPPSKGKRSKAADTRTSTIRPRKASPKKGDEAGATVDEVTADLSKDPRRERDD